MMISRFNPVCSIAKMRKLITYNQAAEMISLFEESDSLDSQIKIEEID